MKLCSDSSTESPLLDRALRAAAQACDKAGVKLTSLRQQVFTIIWQSDKPIGAYQIMTQLKATSERANVAPPTVYRSLDFLLKHRLVHRIHSQNAFIRRNNLGSNHCEVLFICQQCGHTEELANAVMQQTINLAANEMRFKVETQALEIQGNCQYCKASPSSAKDHNETPHS